MNWLRGDVPEGGFLLHSAHSAEDILRVDVAGDYHSLRVLVTEDVADAVHVVQCSAHHGHAFVTAHGYAQHQITVRVRDCWYDVGLR